MERLHYTKCKLVMSLGKYLFTIILICFCTFNNKSPLYLLAQLSELLLIFCITNCISNSIVSYIVNSILIFILNTQIMIFIHSNSYLTYIMLSSVHSINALAGNAAIYVLSFISVIFFSLLPVCNIKINGGAYKIIILSISVELCIAMRAGNMYFPFYNIIKVVDAYRDTIRTRKLINSMDGDLSEFYKQDVTDHREKPEDLPETPNVILIFTEGISRNIIDDPREIMPNVSYYQSQALSFDNYYNHTFATYRGLVGQLYSGYTLNDFDTNSLVSLQGILSNHGYHTIFINTEPNNYEFTRYLESFKFDELISNPGGEYRGISKSLSDKEAYDTLWETVDKCEKRKKPFFISIYTFGTHATFDSQDEKYEDGNSSVLNKFYNADYWFGKFMKKIESSTVSDNTIIVYTGDHCTYGEREYSNAFPDYDRENWMVDTMPLFIWYKGINSETIDVNGRNSITLAPTICDYLDISEENYFLGNSLFSDMWGKSDFDAIFCQGPYMYNTYGSEIKELTEGEKTLLIDRIEAYFGVCSK